MLDLITYKSSRLLFKEGSLGSSGTFATERLARSRFSPDWPPRHRPVGCSALSWACS